MAQQDYIMLVNALEEFTAEMEQFKMSVCVVYRLKMDVLKLKIHRS